jgi:hypothetical protein
MKKIAVLAWGSLVWDQRDLKIAAKFDPTGPRLPIEFCRVSADGRLTLVIDEPNGAECISYQARSFFNNLEAAAANLAEREGMSSTANVGFIDMVAEKTSAISLERHPKSVSTIRAWAVSNEFDAVIWTALGMKFKDATGVMFSVVAALSYLEALEGVRFSRALEYIRRAPPEVQTPVRVAVNRKWPKGRDDQDVVDRNRGFDAVPVDPYRFKRQID